MLPSSNAALPAFAATLKWHKFLSLLLQSVDWICLTDGFDQWQPHSNERLVSIHGMQLLH
jgi:hypothetical protein